MKKVELALGISGIVSALMLLFLIPFGGPLALISFGTLSMFYMFFGILVFNNISLKNLLSKNDFAEILSLNFIGTLGMGFAMSSALIGILFKIMRWPNANFMLAFGLFFMLNIFMIAFFRHHKSNSGNYKFIFRRVLIIGGACLILFFIPSDKILEFKYRNYPSYIEAVKKYNSDPANPELQNEVQKERMKMHFPL
jgi:hypothetical protein